MSTRYSQTYADKCYGQTMPSTRWTTRTKVIAGTGPTIHDENAGGRDARTILGVLFCEHCSKHWLSASIIFYCRYFRQLVGFGLGQDRTLFITSIAGPRRAQHNLLLRCRTSSGVTITRRINSDIFTAFSAFLPAFSALFTAPEKHESCKDADVPRQSPIPPFVYLSTFCTLRHRLQRIRSSLNHSTSLFFRRSGSTPRSRSGSNRQHFPHLCPAGDL